MILRRSALLLKSSLLICASLSGHTSSAQTHQGDSPRTLFEESDLMDAPSVPLSTAVIRELRKQPQNGYLRRTNPQHPEKFFRAAESHLNLRKKEEVDLVVVGLYPLSGADHGWFWIVTSSQDHPRVATYIPDNSVEILPSSHHGYQDLESTWQSPNERVTRTWHYNGRCYKQYKKIDEQLIPVSK
jgi:hypothetical protein